MAAISIGAAAIDRGSNTGGDVTYIGKDVPADGTGTITSVELWALHNMSDCEVATFNEVSGDTFTTRDDETLGAVTAGSKQTFAGLDMDVATGDYLGFYCTAGTLERELTGGADLWYVSLVDHIPCTNQAFSVSSGSIMSLHGIGATVAGVAHTKSLSDTVSIADTIVKAFGGVKTETLTIADTLSKASGLAKGDTVTIADTPIKAVGIAKTDTVTIADTFTRVVAFVRAYSETVTITDTIAKAMSIDKTDTLTITDSISKAISIIFSDTVTITESVFSTIGKYCRLPISRMDAARLTVSRMAVERWQTSRLCRIFRRLL